MKTDRGRNWYKLKGLLLDNGRGELFKNLPILRPLRGQKVFSDELVRAFGCDWSLPMSVQISCSGL
jgi:hypothetical protein